MSEWPRAIEEAYCYWNMLRTLGFAAEDLYFEVGSVQTASGAIEQHACVVLYAGGRTDPKHAFRADCGPTEVSTGMLFELWHKFARDLKAGKIPEPELEALYGRCKAPTQKVELCFALAKRGIEIPP